jgi:hypothetical protein
MIYYRLQSYKIGNSYFIKLNNIRMTDFFKNFDLSSDPFHIFLVVDFFLFQYFYSNLFNKQKLATEK